MHLNHHGAQYCHNDLNGCLNLMNVMFCDEIKDLSSLVVPKVAKKEGRVGT